jgi:hypothetical protein
MKKLNGDVKGLKGSRVGSSRPKSKDFPLDD